MKEKTGWIKKAYGVRTKDDVHEVYAGWAETYEADVGGEYGYVAPQVSIDAFAERFTERGRPVMDVGCGTGLAGVELKRHGFAVIDGLDISPAMLKQAEAKGIYRTLMEGDMTVGLDVPDNAYASAVCVGVFAMGHVGPDGLDELIRIVEPGGVVSFTINGLVFKERNYEGKFKALEEAGLVDCEEVKKIDYLKDAGVEGWFATLAVR